MSDAELKNSIFLDGTQSGFRELKADGNGSGYKGTGKKDAELK